MAYVLISCTIGSRDPFKTGFMFKMYSRMSKHRRNYMDSPGWEVWLLVGDRWGCKARVCKETKNRGKVCKSKFLWLFSKTCCGCSPNEDSSSWQFNSPSSQRLPSVTSPREQRSRVFHQPAWCRWAARLGVWGQPGAQLRQEPTYLVRNNLPGILT